MLDPSLLASTFDKALPYDAYVATGDGHQQESFGQVYNRAALTDAQRALVESFVRDVRVLVASGTWCGDCVAQCPLLARIAEANPDRVDLRFVDRDEHRAFSDAIKINEGARVPTAVFMAEDGAFVSLLGDRTLSRYRTVAAKQLGASCPLPGAPIEDDEIAGALQDWLDEFERVHLLLRLSPRLRQKHGD